MPTYLIHGFRWFRISIRQFVATYDVDDCAPDWIVAPAASHALLNTLYSQHDFIPPCQQPTSISASSTPAPSTNGHSPTRATTSPSPRNNPPAAAAAAPSTLSPTLVSRSPSSLLHPRTANGATFRSCDTTARGFNSWSPVKLLEQYDPLAPAISEPYAFVGDAIIRIPLSADINAEIAAYEAQQAAAATAADAGRKGRASVGELRRAEREAGWIVKLGAKLEPKETVGWYVVVCGDEERGFGDLKKKEEQDVADENNYEVKEDVRREKKERKGLRRFFGVRGREEESAESKRISKVRRG